MYKLPSFDPPNISLPSFENAIENIQNRRLEFNNDNGSCLSSLIEQICTATRNYLSN